ncbi:MAG TPA: DUF4190 domain-containing protein [Tepidisphaeraceae bacterium]
MAEPARNQPNRPHLPSVSMRENRAAVAGLMAGNIGFVVLFVGGIVGVVLGLIALARSRSPQIRGRGMAIASIVVGIASIVSSAAITYSLYERTKNLTMP